MSLLLWCCFFLVVLYLVLLWCLMSLLVYHVVKKSTSIRGQKNMYQSRLSPSTNKDFFGGVIKELSKSQHCCEQKSCIPTKADTTLLLLGLFWLFHRIIPFLCHDRQAFLLHQDKTLVLHCVWKKLLMACKSHYLDIIILTFWFSKQVPYQEMAPSYLALIVRKGKYKEFILLRIREGKVYKGTVVIEKVACTHVHSLPYVTPIFLLWVDFPSIKGKPALPIKLKMGYTPWIFLLLMLFGGDLEARILS
jgi:hypothetical protein